MGFFQYLKCIVSVYDKRVNNKNLVNGSANRPLLWLGGKMTLLNLKSAAKR
jgi:hypothetical protein